MQIERLDLSHQTLLEAKFRQLDLSLSEYCFSNLYLFRQIHQYEVIKLEEEIFIKGLTRDKIPFIMLTTHPTKLPMQLIKQALSHAQILFPIPEEWITFFDKWILQASFNEDDTDYLYTQAKLSTFPGRHLDSKRNQVHQFLDHYEVKIEDLSQKFEDAQQILDLWLKEHEENPSESDYFSCQEAILHFLRLHLEGKIVYVNQQPVGFTIGEWISKNYYAIHFAKASRSIKGLYQYLIQESAKALKENSWMNFEQDLGIPALRYSKLSYQPDLLLKKWRLKLE
jgi:hypothetical protein